MRPFERFVGIDWSGAQGERQKGIAVAACDMSGVCRLVDPTGRTAWSRSAVLDHLVAEKPGTLAGLDFSFSLPWPEEGPLPRSLDQPTDVVGLWVAVENVCRREPHFYAGAAYRPAGGWLSDYMFTSITGEPTWSGPHFRRDRFRLTESVLARTPASAFKIVGAKTVGPASFSGMRVLLALKSALGSSCVIWPFEAIRPARLTVVEIYPGFYKGEIDGRPKGPRDTERLLAFFGASLAGREPETGHELDALVSAAAMRRNSTLPDAFSTPVASMVREGWIFGVPFPTPGT